MNLFRSLTRSGGPLSLDEWANYFSFNGLAYPFGLTQTMADQPGERIADNFAGMVQGAYKRNGIVFACMLVRHLLFSEARFQYQQLRGGRPGDLFATRDLQLLETPWENGTTGDLLTRMIQDADLAGNSFIARRPPVRGGRPSLRRLRPDWMTIVAASETDSPLDADVIGYIYQPGGPGSGQDTVTLVPEQVAHFAPIPDPEAQFRGMSWLTPVIGEILADGAATKHKLKFFENGATPNMVVSLPAEIQRSAFNEWITAFKKGHEGVDNAYKTLFFGAGADAKVVGADLRQLEFKVTQGAGETRIAAAAGVPPVIVGLSEGLQAATYSNYSQARRRLADGTMRPLWRQAAASLSRLVPPQAGARLWYDDRDIPFLKEDVKDAAEIQQTDATSIKTLIDAGYEPGSVVDAVTSGDLRRLKHTGLFSVQLQEPGAQQPPSSSSGDPAARAFLALARG